jgi:hypothetical protein
MATAWGQQCIGGNGSGGGRWWQLGGSAASGATRQSHQLKILKDRVLANQKDFGGSSARVVAVAAAWRRQQQLGSRAASGAA